MQFLPYYRQDCNSGEPITSNLPVEYCMEIGSALTDTLLPTDDASLVPPTVPVCPNLLYEKIERCFRQMEVELGLGKGLGSGPREGDNDNGNRNSSGDVNADGALVREEGSNDDGYLLNDSAPCEDDDMTEVLTHPIDTHPLTSSFSPPSPTHLPASHLSPFISTHPPSSPQDDYAELEGIVVRALSGKQTAFDRVCHNAPCHNTLLMRYPITIILTEHTLT